MPHCVKKPLTSGTLGARMKTQSAVLALCLTCRLSRRKKGTTMSRQPMSNADAGWFQMESPTNPMKIAGSLSLTGRWSMSASRPRSNTDCPLRAFQAASCRAQAVPPPALLGAGSEFRAGVRPPPHRPAGARGFGRLGGGERPGQHPARSLAAAVAVPLGRELRRGMRALLPLASRHRRRHRLDARAALLVRRHSGFSLRRRCPARSGRRGGWCPRCCARHAGLCHDAPRWRTAASICCGTRHARRDGSNSRGLATSLGRVTLMLPESCAPCSRAS